MTVSHDLFGETKLKIKWADQHIDKLHATFTAFVQTDFCRLGVEKNSDTGQHCLQFKMISAMPPEIPLIIGDALHNMRAALDFMMTAIVRAAGASVKHVKFPVYETRQKLIDGVRGGKIQAAGKDIITLIVDEIRPYRDTGGNFPLCALNDLDISDKHLLLVPVISLVALVNANITLPGGIKFRNCDLLVGEDGVLGLVSMPSSFEFDGGGQPAFDVVFDKGQPFEGESVIPTLHQLSQLVAGIVQTIEKAYLART